MDEYNEHVDKKLNAISSAVEEGSSSTVARKRGFQQLSEDIDTFSPFEKFFGPSRTFNAKKDFYRLISLLLSDLALIFNIRYPTPWQVISELQTRGIIDESDMNNIKVCLSIANEIRLKTYLASDKQKEVLSSFPRYISANTTEQQAEQSPNNFHFYPGFDEDVTVHMLCTSMDVYWRCTEFCDTYNETNEVDTSLLRNTPAFFLHSESFFKGLAYIKLKNFPKAFKIFEPLSKDSEKQHTYLGVLQALGYIHIYHRNSEKSIKYFEKALELCTRLIGQNDETRLIEYQSIITCDLAAELNTNGEYEKALSTLKVTICKLIKIYVQGFLKLDLELLRSMLRRLMRQLGVTHGDLGNYESAIKIFKFVEWMLSEGGFDGELFDIKILLAQALAGKTDCSQASKCAKEALYLAHKLYGNEDTCLAEIYQRVGMVYERCHWIEDALFYYEQSLTMYNFTIGDNPFPGKVR